MTAPSSWRGLGTWQWIPLSLQNHWAHLCRSVVFLFPLFLTDILWQGPVAIHQGLPTPTPPKEVSVKFYLTSSSWLAGSHVPTWQSSGSRWSSQPRTQTATSDARKSFGDELCSPPFEVPSFYQRAWTLTSFQGSFYYCLWTGLR